MFSLTKHQTRLIRSASSKLLAGERELALVKMQREAMQKTLNDLLKTSDKEPLNAGDT